MQNTPKRTLLIWLAVGLIGFLMFLAPIIYPIDMMHGGGAMIVIGILFAITGPIVAFMYYNYAKVFDELMDESKLLAHFKYNPTEWKKFAADEKLFRSGEQRTLQIIVISFSVLFGGIFWWADPETGWIVALVLLAVNILIAIIVFFNSRSLAKLENAQNVECRLGSSGTLFNQTLYVWVGWGARLESARTNFGSLNILEIVYSTPNRYSRQYYTLRIPIPSGEENKAQEVVSKLSPQ
jgi:H+/gluconate symporter-like permease